MYDNGTKQTWRGWAWNQIQKRIPRGGRVVVLAGNEGLDYEYARKRGLECIGVDTRKDCVAKFRSLGGVAIQDKVHRQILALKPDGVILDMLGGLTEHSWRTVALSTLPCRAVVWNGLRGRDTGVGAVADSLQHFHCPDYSIRPPTLVSIGKHRGRIAFTALSLMHWISMHGKGLRQEDADTWPDMPERFIWQLGQKTKPEYMSYRSKDSGQYFDSVAWSNLTEVTAVARSQPLLNNTARCKRSKRKAAAAKALLTQRRNHATD